MKRWICLFLSLTVCVSALSLGVHAEDNTPNENLYVYVNATASTDDFSTEINAAGSLSDRCLTYNYNQKAKIKGFSFSLPASKWFLIDFDIVGDDSQWQNNGGVPSCSASVNIPNLNSSVFTINGLVSLYRAEVRTYYSPGKVHFSIFGCNNTDALQSVSLTFNNPIIITGSSIPASNIVWNTRFSNITAITTDNFNVLYQRLVDIVGVLEYSYSEIIVISDTLGNFYNEFNAKWSLLVDTYIYNLYDQYWKSAFPFYNGITENQDGTVTLNPKASRRFGFGVANSLTTIIDLMYHQDKIINQAMEQGAGDSYESLNDSADFGSLSDFAGAGSAASWSSGSFSNGLSGIWDFFSNDTFYDLDTTDNRHDINVYHEEFYQNNLSDYFDIVGSDYDGSTSNSSN